MGVSSILNCSASVDYIDNLTLAQVKVLNRDKASARAERPQVAGARHLAAHAAKNTRRSFPAVQQQQRGHCPSPCVWTRIAMLFDEPTPALDPEMINEVLDVIGRTGQRGDDHDGRDP